MTTFERLNRWRDAGAITSKQFEAISRIVLKERFSVFLELNALLYLGVVFLVGGLAWTAQTHFERLGDPFILLVLTSLLGISLYYCFTHSRPYSTGEVESPTLVFDYVLYAGCLILSAELGYIETRFQLLGTAWEHYLLFASAVFFGLAYRFDNRLVLSLALSSLAGWFGLRFSRFGFITADSIRVYALIYGGLVAGAGTWLYRQGVKKHFLETYLHVAANVVFVALLSGLEDEANSWIYISVLLALCFLACFLGVKFRRFAYVAYGIVYGYVGASYQVLSNLREMTAILSYIAVTGTIVIVALAKFARRFAREEE